MTTARPNPRPSPVARAVGVVALAASPVALSACGGGVSDTTSASGDAVVLDVANFEPATSGELHLYTWTDYFPDSLADRFTEETGIELTIDTYDSNETLEAKLIATDGTGYDIVVPSDYMVLQLIEAGLLASFDATALPNGGNIGEEFLDVYFDEGRQFSVPYAYGTTGYAYDSSLTDEELTSWADFFDPPEELGQVGILNDQLEVVNAALRANGFEACTADTEAYAAVEETFAAFGDRISSINSDDIYSRLSSGQESIIMTWSGEAARAAQDNPDIVYVFPEEGMSLWQDNFAIPVGAENTDQALTFINWMMDPENSAEAANYIMYSSPITGAEEFYSEEMASAAALNIPEDYDGAESIAICSNEINDNYTQVWNGLKQG